MYNISKEGMEELQKKLTKLQLEKAKSPNGSGWRANRAICGRTRSTQRCPRDSSYKLKEIADTIATIENSRGE